MTAVEKIISEINNELLTLESLHGSEIIGRKIGLAFAKRVAGQAKEMEKEQKQRFNKFLNDEMELGISDKKTIERIQWYYNNYLLTFKSE